MAWLSPPRSWPVTPITQSSRVWLTIVRIVAMPRPSSPTSHPRASSSSISLDALDRLPSLSFRRWITMPLRVPSGSRRGTAKQDSPASVFASIRNRSLIGAEQNHLCPVSAYGSPGPVDPVASARVVLARTSEPPCFSVMAMPAIAPAFGATPLPSAQRSSAS
jgi:hypothetical protein